MCPGDASSRVSSVVCVSVSVAVVHFSCVKSQFLSSSLSLSLSLTLTLALYSSPTQSYYRAASLFEVLVAAAKIERFLCWERRQLGLLLPACFWPAALSLVNYSRSYWQTVFVKCAENWFFFF